MKPPLVTAYVAKGTRESIDPGPSKTDQSERSLEETFTWNWGTPNLANTKKSLAMTILIYIILKWFSFLWASKRRGPWETNLSYMSSCKNSFHCIDFRISEASVKSYLFLTSWYRAPPQKKKCYPKDHWTLQSKGLNLYSKGRVLKIAQFWGVRKLRIQ